jgi:predicted nucleic acid-binding protein
VLDACVLLPASLRDTLLRLAETPRQYVPKWSDEIWNEVTRNLARRCKLSPEQIAHLIDQVQQHFPEATVSGYEKMIGLMTNEPKDRHVVAAAVRCGAQVIVTANLKDFPARTLAEWGIEAQHPDEFLIHLVDLSPAVVVSKLHDQAATIARSLPDLLRTLRNVVPQFASAIASKLDLEL